MSESGRGRGPTKKEMMGDLLDPDGWVKEEHMALLERKPVDQVFSTDDEREEKSGNGGQKLAGEKNANPKKSNLSHHPSSKEHATKKKPEPAQNAPTKASPTKKPRGWQGWDHLMEKQRRMHEQVAKENERAREKRRQQKEKKD